jgi:hypothetical protein
LGNAVRLSRLADASLLTEAVFFHAIAERVAGEPEEPGCGALVATRPFERLLDEGPLDGL